jgi:hypothetical protein
MSLAQAQIVNRPERRRSERASLALPVIVRGVSLDAKPFQDETFTLSVSAHGALVALTTTVTLGQALFLRNPQTQEEVGAWVTRFGPPRGGLAQVGVELVHPDVEFWSSRPRTRSVPVIPVIDETERRADQQIHVLPGPGENAAAELSASASAAQTPQPATISSRSGTPGAAGPPDGLLRALEQTLQQAAEQVVASASTTRLSAAVNQAAAAIENFGNSRIRQLEERLAQYREELVTSSREEFLSRLKADIEQTEERLRNRATELLQDGAAKAHSDFGERIRETAEQSAARFDEQAAGLSGLHAARLAEQAQASMSDARARIDSAAGMLAEAQEKIRVDTDRAINDVQQRVEALTSQCKEVYAECEARLRAFQEELTRSSAKEVEAFRERLRGVLTTLLSSLG